MPRDDDQSLGDQNTFNSENRDERDAGPESLGDEMTFAGGPGVSGPQSLGDEGTFGGNSGSVDDSFDDDMEIVDLAARYTTEGMLGKGGMGEVLLATDTRLNRKVAIKRILGSAARSKTAVSRFLTEAQSIAALNHPNIVQIYDYGRAKDGPFLIMEFVEGSSLLDKCREGAIPFEEAIDLTCQLCDGLSKAHAANIVHRDIKPANVLLTEDGVPKLTDFGLAKDEAADTGMTMAGAVIGTLDFMPPEQRKDAALTDNRSDLWSLAATLYQMVTGKSPKIIKFNDVPKTLQDVLGKALEDSKDDRYQNALELKEALQGALTGGADAYAELDQGECPHCGTKNDASRKFCRNPDCGGSLEVPCLTCKTSIPMWEAVCGSCGAKQEPLVDRRRKEMSSQKDQAEAFVANHNYDQARRVLAKVEGVKDLRLQQLTGWVATFKDHLQAEEDRAVEIAGKRIHEAREHEVASDYPSAIKSLEQIPDSLRGRKLKNQSLAAGTFLGQLQRKQQEVQNLERQLRERVKAKQLAGLLIEVESLLRLVPNHSNALKLKEQLLARDEKLKGLRDKLYSEAVRNLESQDYKAALSALSRIDSTQVNSAVKELRDQAETIISTLVSLNKQIKEKLAAKEYSELENLVDHFLILKAEDNEKQRLKQQLVERDGAREQAREEGFAEAQEQFKQHGYKNALASLGKIPRELVDSEVLELRDQIKGSLTQIENLELELGRLSEDGDATALQACLQAYLALQPNDKERQERLTRLIDKEQKSQELADNAFSQAGEHANQFQFENALMELAKIPESRLTDEIRSFAQSCSKLKTLREKALYELKKSFRFHTYAKALEAARVYQSGTSIVPTDKDTEFHDLRERCLDSQKNHAEESNRLAEKQALKKKAIMIAVLAAVIAMVVGGVMWANKISRSSELMAALKDQRWNDALAIDSVNQKALAGQTRVLLSSDPPDVSAALDLLNRIEAAQPGTDTVAPLKAEVFALQSQAYAKAGEIDKAEGFLNDAVKFGVTEPAAGETRHAIGIAYIKQATDFLNSDSDDTYARAESSLQQAGAFGGNFTALKAVHKLASARYLAKAESLLDEGMLAESGELISRAESHDTTSPLLGSVKTRYLKLDAEAKADRGDHSGSLASYEAAARTSEQSFVTERARQHVEIGKSKLASEDVQAAIVHLKQAIRIDESLLAIADLAIPLTRLLVDQCESKNTDESFQKAGSTAKSALPYVAAQIDKRQRFDADFNRLCSLLMQSALVIESEITEATLQIARKRIVQYQSLNAVRQVEQSDAGLRVMQAFADFEVTKTTTKETKLLLEVWDLIYPKVVDENLVEKQAAGLTEAYSVRFENALKEENYQVASQLDQILRAVDIVDATDPTDAWLEIPLHKWAGKVTDIMAAQLLADLQSKIGQQFTDSNYAQASVTYEAIGHLDKTAQQNITDLWLSMPHAKVRDLSDDTRARLKALVSARAIKSGDYQKALVWDRNNAEALSMKKSAGVRQALSDGDYSAALQLDPSNAEALAMKKTADVLQALADGDYIAALELDPDNAGALAMKQAADVRQAMARGDYFAALQLEPTNAEARAAVIRSSPITNSIGMKLKLIPMGTFMMGSTVSNNEHPRHRVTLTKAFGIGIHEVTEAQYTKVMGDNPSESKGENYPVEAVSWDDAVEFCQKLSSSPAEKAAGRVYRLPTESEWEYACRAGTTTEYSFGESDSGLGNYAWFDKNSGARAHAVGGRKPNALGLYDMHGNVWEWCQDSYVLDPSRYFGVKSGSDRVLRGGSWSSTAVFCRSAVRGRGEPSVRRSGDGFRVVCVTFGE